MICCLQVPENVLLIPASYQFSKDSAVESFYLELIQPDCLTEGPLWAQKVSDAKSGCLCETDGLSVLILYLKKLIKETDSRVLNH